jgi:hypothetical protein
MAALRKTFLAIAAFAAVTTTASSAFAQTNNIQPFTCSISGVPTLMRYQGLTEYLGDIVVTCTGGTPVTSGTQVPTANFQVDLLNATNFTSRLLNDNLPSNNGGFPYTEAILGINEALPIPGTNNPSTAGLSSPYGLIYQHACPTSNQGSCFNTGTGNGGYGGGGSGSSYAPVVGDDGVSGAYNVFQGYLHSVPPTSITPASSKEMRFDGIPMDPPGSTGSIEFRITNLRVDATYFSAAGPGILTPVFATVTITGTQPPAVTGSNAPLVAYATNGIVAPAPNEVASPICSEQQPFIVPIQEGFASSFKRRTWFANNFNSPDPNLLNGSAPDTSKSTQNIFGFQYFTESNFYDETNVNLREPDQVGLATNGTRLYITLTNINPGVTVTAPAYAGLFGGQPLVGPLPVVGSPSGILYLVGKSPSYPSDLSGYLNTTTDAVPIAFTASAGNTSTTFVYEVLNSDPSAIETAYVRFPTSYSSSISTPVPPLVLSSQVGFAPLGVTPTVGDVPDSTPVGTNAYPRFVPGSPTAQPDWFLAPCQCDLLFPFAVSSSTFETGIAIDNTSADPYGTARTPGYIQLFYYLGNIIKKSALNAQLAALEGNDGTRSDFQQTTANWIAPGDSFLLVVGTGGNTTTGGSPGVGAATPLPTWGADPGVVGAPGFEGYIFAVTTFQYCHGYAFIQTRDNGMAEGYLPLVIDHGSWLPRGSGTPDGFGTPGLSIQSPETVQQNAYNN